MSNRLDTIISLVPKCDVVADIGTDHAYVPIQLIKKGIASECIACDLRKGPLDIAKKNIQQNGLDNKIKTRLGGGLQVLNHNEVNCVIIAGMGGVLIKNILEEGKEKLSRDTIIIAQPNIYQDKLRQWFYQNGYDIYNEKLVLEDKKMYTIMCAKRVCTKRKVDEIKYYIGDNLYKEPLYKMYLCNMINKYKRALHGVEKMKKKDVCLQKNYEWLINNLEKELKNIIEGDGL